jgi:TfoX/Sxy family transcriptional regulator of competence genes
MAYNEKLADRMREHLVDLKKIEEKKMMGGLCFMYKGKMCCGIVKDDLMVRVVESRQEEALSNPNGRPMDFTGKPLKNFVFVSPDGIKKNKELSYWLDMGVEYVDTLPTKKVKKKSAKKSVTKKTSKRKSVKKTQPSTKRIKRTKK